jgi:peptidoglycan/xylan/chitin deacetylase (PgdA/CDA1 family)
MNTTERSGAELVPRTRLADTVGSVPILMYHLVTSDPVPALRRYTVSPAAFASQMRWLAYSGYTPITLDRLVEHGSGADELPDRPVAITFDDGFLGLLDHAVPTLLDRGFVATIFLVAGLMGQTARWLPSWEGDKLRLLDWGTARELDSIGFQCGAHTLTHPRLTEVSPATRRLELRRSRELLEDGLGRAIAHVAYPFGACDEAVASEAASAGFRIGCSTRPGVARPGNDLLSLPRISVYRDESLIAFVCRLRTAHSPRELLRRKRQQVRRWTGEASNG